MVKKLFLILFLLIICSFLSFSANKNSTKNPLIPYNKIKNAYIYVEGIEGGPVVSKVIVELSENITNISKNDWTVTTNGANRKITDIFISDKNGNKKTESNFITFNLSIETLPNSFSYVASPFTYNRKIFMNEWAKEYIVKINGTADITSKNQTENKSTKYSFNFEKDAISNRIVPDADLFNYRSSITKVYTNPITKNKDTLTLQLAAYEPESLKQGAKKPLIIWLHGQGEGGTDPDITILGNESAALARQGIQSYFSSKNNKNNSTEKGAFVLIVQSPTYWMDEGDGTNGNGSGISRYTGILMDAIQKYVKENPYIDTNRIYIGGDSNGGYMTMNMIIEYPNYFAAAYPICEAYSFYEYEKNPDGTYKRKDSTATGTDNFTLTNKRWFTDKKVEKIKNLPIWFINSANDPVVIPKNFSLPTYQALVKAGAKNVWYSYFESVIGSDVPGTEYLGHLSWVYVLNNEVEGVQNVEKIKNSTDTEKFGFEPSNSTRGGSEKAVFNNTKYDNLFKWMNAQKK